MKKIMNEKGQAVVEMAITLPLLLLLLCGIIDFGWLFFNQLNLANYSREATRYGIVNSSNLTNSEITTTVQRRVKDLCVTGNGEDLVINVGFSNTTQASKGDITVKIEKQIKTLTPISRIFAPDGNVNVSSEITMRIE